MAIKPLARVVASASGAVEPKIMGMGVVPAVNAIGMTGVRIIIIAAINELKRRGGRYACATMCASGGPGCAFIIEGMA